MDVFEVLTFEQLDRVVWQSFSAGSRLDVDAVLCLAANHAKVELILVTEGSFPLERFEAVLLAVVIFGS